MTPRRERVRPGTPLSLEDARRLVKGYVDHYNDIRLNSAVGCITSKDMLAGRQREIQDNRIGNWSGEGVAGESPKAGRVTDEADYFRLAAHPKVGRTSQYKCVWTFLRS